MLIDIGDDVLSQEGLHLGSLLAVVLDRRGVDSSFVSALIADFTGLLNIVYRLAEEPRRDPNDFLEIFFISAGCAELQAIQTHLHAIFHYIRGGKTSISRQEHIWRFKVFFKPFDGGDQPLGVHETLTDVERSNFDDASFAHLLGNAFEKLPVEVGCRILTELQGAERATVIAALRQFYLDGTWRGRSDG